MHPQRTVVGLVVVALVLAGCGGRREVVGPAPGGAITCQLGQDSRIGIATGNSTGVYYALGGAYAEAISAATGGRLKATAAETGASVQNIAQLVNGDYQVAFSLADTAADAVAGKASFEGRPQPVRALARIYPNFTQVVVRTDAGIGSVADMRGKRISTGSPKSGTEVIAQRVLRAAGLNPDTDVAAQRLDLTKTVDGMKNGTVDALFFSGGLPTPGILDLFTSLGDRVRLLDVTATLGALQQVNPVYDVAAIPAGTYGSSQAETRAVVVPNLLLVDEKLDPNTACVLTRVLFDRQPDLQRANAAAAEIRLDRARDTAPVPLHPGSVAALDQLGAP